MQPPYIINNEILALLTTISEKIGAINAYRLNKPSPGLRKRNRVQTIKASLAIEGNRLSEDQITAIIEQKRVVGPQKDIQEVQNAIEVYEQLPLLKVASLSSFLQAHERLMKGLIDAPGQLRTRAVGIFKGEQVSHIAPAAANVHYLMEQLFDYLKQSDDPVLIKSCVVHYEIEFIHPFLDGNGRMGRLWQSLILMQAYPVFEFLPFETLIKDRQDAYYEALEQSDKEGSSAKFIIFMLQAIHDALEELLKTQNKLISPDDRLAYFIAIWEKPTFVRKDYLTVLSDISAATASRDLQYGVENAWLLKEGDKRTTVYHSSKKR